MQQIEIDQNAVVADGDASKWVGALPLAIDAHNKRPHSAVFDPPETVENRPEQDFKVLQANVRRVCSIEAAKQKQRAPRGWHVQSSAT